MFIPLKFDEILRKDQEKLGIVYKTVSDFGKILEVNNMEFFPDYTDHGIKHIENVLFSTQSLITDDSFEHLNSIDITLIILATIVHDIGMHISHPGFLRLLGGHYDKVRVEGFDKNVWIKNWELFFNEAKKFNQKQRMNIWGDKNVNINEPPTNNLSENDRKLIGEFIRRYHPRLAHEIVLNGFPTAEGDNIEFANGLETNIKDIVGLVARSHGIPIRNTFDYLERKFHKSKYNPYESKIVFIMGLLRIADYIHIDSTRADKVILRTKSLASPISQQEWEKQNAIKFISVHTDDPELIHIQAEPQNSVIYLELKKLFKDIQREFDLTWAVIGEVYGRNEELNKLKYKYRRIISTIDDKEKFLGTSKYIPEKIIFDSDPELLKLLVAPLYGNNSTFGVRELLQNAVDACLERQYLILKRNGVGSKEYLEYKPEIIINIDKNESDEYFFTIIDNGIGMTKEVLINYFFKAGASFIYSDIWKNSFIEESGSTVRRSGRFGIGILAAFLLGNEIIINTRNIDSINSFECSALIDSEQIEVIKSTFEIGTSITIKLTDEIIKRIRDKSNDKFDWFTWYRFPAPIINYNINEEIHNKFIFLKDDDLIPDSENNNRKWRTSYPDSYNKVLWTLSPKYHELKSGLINYFYKNSKKLYLFCNGFCIPGGYKKERGYYNNELIISVFDFNSKLPLTLDRYSLDGNKIPFYQTILEDIAKDIIARLLTLEINSQMNYSELKELKIEYLDNIDLTGEIIFKDKGYFLFCNHIFKKIGTNMITHFWFYKNMSTFSEITKSEINIIYLSKYKSYKSFNERVHSLRESYFGYRSFNTVFLNRNIQMKRIIINKDRYNYLFEKNKNRAANFIKYYYEIENVVSDKWVTLINKSLKKFVRPNLYQSQIKFEKLDEYKDNIELIVESYFDNADNRRDNEFSSSIYQYLDKYLKPDYIIPYDMEERKKKFPLAFSELDRFIKKYL